MQYRTFNDELKERFGTKVYKLSLSSGCLCPNRDGLKGYGGCSFCSEGGSGDFAAAQYHAAFAPHIHIDNANTLHSDSKNHILNTTDSIPSPHDNKTFVPCAESADMHTAYPKNQLYIPADILAKAPYIPVPSAKEQLAAAKARVDAKFPSNIPASERRYIAYFQSFTNTYGDIERLRTLFSEALAQPEIVGLSIGTRPDCLPPEMIDMLASLQKDYLFPLPHAAASDAAPAAPAVTSGAQKPIWVELGLQSIHEKSAQQIRRAYALDCFENAYQRLKAAGLQVVVHVILGLPDETKEDMLATVRYLANLSPRLDGIKLQLLHVLRGTALEKQYQSNPFHVMELDEYCALVVACLKLLSPEITVHRITGDGPKKLLIAPLWSADKKRVLNALHRAIHDA